MVHGETIGLVTRTMGRRQYLERTLPTWCRLSEIDRITIVDWGMTEDLALLVDSVHDSRIEIVGVPEQKYFSNNKARNTGIRHTVCDWVFMIDAEVPVAENFFSLVGPAMKNPCLIVQHPWQVCNYGLCGTALFPRDAWNKVNGYLDSLEGYGYDEAEFYRRLEKHIPRVPLDFYAQKIWDHIPHSWESKFLYHKSKRPSKAFTKERHEQCHRLAAQQIQEHFECVIRTEAGIIRAEV